jgi:iron(III) transport system ATP-binding protein
MVRLERVRLAAGEGENTLKLPLVTSMFLGDRWEHVFRKDSLALRAYTHEPLGQGEYWLDLPTERLWIF